MFSTQAGIAVGLAFFQQLFPLWLGESFESGYLAFWLFGCLAIWFSGCLGRWLEFQTVDILSVFCGY